MAMRHWHGDTWVGCKCNSTSSASNTGTWLGGATTLCLWVWEFHHEVWVTQHWTHRSDSALLGIHYPHDNVRTWCSAQFVYWFSSYTIIWPNDVLELWNSCSSWYEATQFQDTKDLFQTKLSVNRRLLLLHGRNLAKCCNFSCFLCKHTGHWSSSNVPISVGILVVSIAAFFGWLCWDLTGHTGWHLDRHPLETATSQQFEIPPSDSRVC